MNETLVAPRKTEAKRINKATQAQPSNSGIAAVVEVVIDPTQWTFAATNGQDKIVVGKCMPCRIRQKENKVRDPSTTPTTATTATQIELGTYVPTVQCHCAPSAGTKVYDARAMRPDGRCKTMSRST